MHRAAAGPGQQERRLRSRRCRDVQALSHDRLCFLSGSVFFWYSHYLIINTFVVYARYLFRGRVGVVVFVLFRCW